jgi:hypothetical protein
VPAGIQAKAQLSHPTAAFLARSVTAAELHADTGQLGQEILYKFYGTGRNTDPYQSGTIYPSPHYHIAFKNDIHVILHFICQAVM